MDIYKNTGLCPEIYIRKFDKNEDTKISTALVDTGAETSILSLSALEEVFGLTSSHISPLDYTLSLRSSTGVVQNAVLGTVKLKISILNEAALGKKQSFHHWSQAVVTFMVTSNDVSLTKIILGAPFMHKHRVTLSFSPRPRLTAALPDLTGNGKLSRCRLKIVSDKINLHLCQPITPEDNSAEFLLSNLVMLNNFSLDIINDSKIELPSRVNFRNYLQKWYKHIESTTKGDTSHPGF